VSENALRRDKTEHLDGVTLFELALTVIIVAIHAYANTAPTLTPGALPVHDAVYIVRRVVMLGMPGFIFTAGMKYAMSRKKRAYFRYLGGRVKRVYLPYVVWCAVYYLYFCFFAAPRFAYDFSPEALGSYILRGNLVSHLYFVVIIMQFYILAPAVLKFAKLFRAAGDKLAGSSGRTLLRAAPTAALAVLAAAAQFLAIALSRRYPNAVMWDRVFPYYIFFWVLGTCAGLDIDRAVAFIRRRQLAVAAAAAVPAAAYAVLFIKGYYGHGWHRYIEELRVLAAAGEMFILLTVCLRVRFGRLSGVMNKLHGASFYVYLAHPLAIYAVTARALPDRFSARFTVVFAAALVPAAALACGYVVIKDKLKRKLNKGLR
jgi:membrane-bound acyltransferase YfiQ involved in biofilm formation